jgi:Cytochrome c554 and c-prime
MNGRSIRRNPSKGLACIPLAACALLGLGLRDAGKEAAPKSSAAANRYIGADKCKLCHTGDSAGNPFAAWQTSDHSRAFEKLASDAARKAGKERGVDEPQKSDKCLKCHTTAFGAAADLVKKGFDAKLGVQCEACHGPGELHMKARLSAAAQDDGASSGEKGNAALAKIPEGEIAAHVDQKTCLACHNDESPTFQSFCFYEKRAKIQHLDPRKAHSKEDTLVCGCDKCPCKHGSDPEKCGVEPKDKKK